MVAFRSVSIDWHPAQSKDFCSLFITRWHRNLSSHPMSKSVAFNVRHRDVWSRSRQFKITIKLPINVDCMYSAELIVPIIACLMQAILYPCTSAQSQRAKSPYLNLNRRDFTLP